MVKKFYVTIFVIFGLCISIFLLSFVYLDKNKHKIYYYTVNIKGQDVGTIKIDKFVTEEKHIYKSSSSTPLYELFTESKIKIVYDRNYNLESYMNERMANGATELVYIESRKNTASYIARLNSGFAFLDNIKLRDGTFIFEENLPATYIALIENYDFSRGRSQGFSAISCFSNWELPPMKRFVTFTSIRDEYLKLGSRKIKTENLLLKIRNFPQGAIWVAKSDRSLIKIEIPSKGIIITRTFEPKDVSAKNREASNANSAAADININNDGLRLDGTFQSPTAAGVYPAVLLVWGDGPDNRNYRGLFDGIASYLSSNGFCVLRFDKRGIGSSEGSYNAYSGSDEISDLKKAVDFLRNQKNVDPEKIFILAHSKGARFAAQLAAEDQLIKGLIFMAPALYSRYSDYDKLPWYPASGEYKKWNSEYLKSLEQSTIETKARALSAKGNWIFIFFRRCFVKRIKEEAGFKYTDVVAKIKAPALILQGSKDETVPAEAASDLDKLLQENGNLNHTLTFYGYLGHFFGREIIDGIHQIYYEVDKDVLLNLKTWLDKILLEYKKEAEILPEAPAPTAQDALK